MPSIQIKSIPQSLFDQLKAQAKKHHRSVAGEALNIIEIGLRTPQRSDLHSLFEEIDVIRDQIQAKYGTHPSSADMIREDRDSR